jgi:predicted TIM-barrel fold metal-dependent hydrolase
VTVETEYEDWRSERPVIDAHAHYSPSTVEDCVRFMDRSGVATMVDLDPNVGEAFSERLDAIADYPGRFGLFTGVDFEGFGEPGWVQRECERLEAAFEAGAAGVKFWKDLGLNHTDEQGAVIRVDDERLAPIVDLIGQHDRVAAFHIADPQPFFEPLTPENPRYETLQAKPEWWFGDREEYPYGWWDLLRQLETVIGRHPDTTILGAHFGCAAEEPEYVASVLRDHPNYVIDTGARMIHLGQHDPETVRSVFEEFPDRILFGTDLVLRDVTGTTIEDVTATYDDYWQFFETDRQDIVEHDFGDWTVDGLDLPRDVLEGLYVENAMERFEELGVAE